MRVVALAAQKGGAGKTTLCVHLAVAAMRAGERVAILDLDPQGSAVAWGAARGDDDALTVLGIDPLDLEDALDVARADGLSTVFLDTAPRAAPSAAAVLKAATFTVVPVRPSAFDLAALDRSVAIVNAAGTPGAIVLNGCPTRAPEVAEAVEVCQAQPLPLCGVHVGDRRAFSRAVSTGRAVEEFSPRSLAASEIRALWAFIARSGP